MSQSGYGPFWSKGIGWETEVAKCECGSSLMVQDRYAELAKRNHPDGTWQCPDCMAKDTSRTWTLCKYTCEQPGKDGE